MKKAFLIVLFTILLALPFSVKALTTLQIRINDNGETPNMQTGEVATGDYILPEFCSIDKGCTVIFDIKQLETIGKYSSTEGYLYIESGTGAKISHQNSNELVFEGTNFKNNVVIKIGNNEEERKITFISSIKDYINDSKNDNKTEKTNSINTNWILISGISVSVVLIAVVVLIIKRKQSRHNNQT